MQKIYISVLLLCLFFLCGIILNFFPLNEISKESLIREKNNGLLFHLQETSKNPVDIYVDNAIVIKNGRDLYPITAQIIHPIEIKVGQKKQTIHIDSLQKDTVIPIYLKYKDRMISYRLHTLPKQFPQIMVKKNSDVPNGYILISFHGLKLKDPSYSIITDSSGQIVYYRGNEKPLYSMFHLQQWRLKNGKIRYSMHIQEEDSQSLISSFVSGYHLVLNENFEVIDKVRLLPTPEHPELLADEHEFILLDDGHYVVLGYKPIRITLSNNKTSLGFAGIVQEQKDGRVVFEWSGENNQKLIDGCYERCPALMPSQADFMHVNSIHIDPNDNHFVISLGSSYSLIKLHRKTGQVLWYLGGKNDEFGLTEQQKFLRQHDAQILSSGELILFDNATTGMWKKEYDYFNKQPIVNPARIIVMNLDEENKKLLSFREIPLNFYAKFMGSVQKLSSDKWFVGCGSSTECAAKLIDAKGNDLLIMSVKQPYTMYRAYWVDSLN